VSTVTPRRTTTPTQAQGTPAAPPVEEPAPIPPAEEPVVIEETEVLPSEESEATPTPSETTEPEATDVLGDVIVDVTEVDGS
jgi:hypothetical protein